MDVDASWVNFASVPTACMYDDPMSSLPQVFAQLATVHSACTEDEPQLPDPYSDLDCFSIVSLPPHAGLRQFPFLSQVWHTSVQDNVFLTLHVHTAELNVVVLKLPCFVAEVCALPRRCARGGATC